MPAPYKTKASMRWLGFHGGPAGTRTPDLGIKSPLLYQLSYRSMAIMSCAKRLIMVREAMSLCKQKSQSLHIRRAGVGNRTRTDDLQSHNLAF